MNYKITGRIIITTHGTYTVSYTHLDVYKRQPILCVGLYLIMTNAHPRFKAMLEKYDALNSDVQENLIAIRVVKAFVREKYESDKFDSSAEAVRATQYRAEKLVQLNQPLMQICMYGLSLIHI